MTRLLALTLLIGFFAFLPSAFADGEKGLHITPADVHQSASSGTTMLTLKATNIQVRAKWRLDGDSPFAITDNGELRLTATLSDPDTIVATVIVEDMFSELNSGYQNLAATAFITVEFISDTLTATVRTPEPLILADAPPLTVTVINATVSLHTFTASGGLGTLTYALIGDNTLHFSIDERGGVLRIDETATVGIYTLSVEVADGAITPATAVATVAVEMLEPLILVDAPPLTATVINATVSLHTFTASGGLGTLTYVLIGDHTLHFSIDERGGVLRIDETATMGIYTLSVEVADGAITPQKATAVATVTVEMLEPLILADAPPLTVTVINATVSLHTFTASGGLGAKTYALIAGNAGYFSIGDNSGVLQMNSGAVEGIYTLSVEVADGAIIPQRATAMATVTVVETLFLADAPPLTATAGAAASLHTFTASGGWGAKTYTLIADSAGYFSIDERDGVLQIDETATMGIYTLSVAVADGAIIPQRATAMATVTVVETLFLADAPPLTATVINATVSLHTFTASGGLGTLTYALIGDNTLHFSIDERDGVLRIDETATVGIYTLSVEVADGAITPQKATAVATVTVEMLEPLILADAPPLTVTVINATVSLHTFTASGGLGTLTYVLIGDNNLHFSIDEKDGVLWIDETATVGIYTLSVEVADEAIIPQKATAVATVTVVGELRIINLPANVLFAVSGIGRILHTFQTSGGESAPTFHLYSASSDFYLDELGGVLSVAADAAVGVYTLTVEVADGAIIPQKATVMATVAVVEALTLKAKVSDRARDLHAFAPYASAYSIVAGNDGYFTIGETSGTLAVQAWTPVGNYPLNIGITYTFSLGIPPKVVVSAVVVEITDYPTPTQRKIYVLGGYGRGNDVWSSVNGTNWSLETSSAAWSERSYHQAVSHNGKIYVLGGDFGRRNDVWSSVNGINWRLETSSAAWSERHLHQAVSHNGRLYVLGGYDGSNRYNDVWSSVDGANWLEETDDAGWTRRFGHQALSHNGRLYVLGGSEGSNSRLNDVWSSADGANWSREPDNAEWAGRRYHQALSHNGRIYVLGGDDGSLLNDVWSSADGKNWSLETANAGWEVRKWHQALSHNGRLYVLGGTGGLNDVWSSADGKEWALITLSADWSGRSGHQAVVFPSPLVLFGVGEKITMTAGVAADNLHTFTAQYGKGNYTYSLEPAVDGFAVSGNGVLSEDGTAMADAYTLSVFVADEEDNIAQTAIRVNVIRLSLSFLDASEEWTLPFGWSDVLKTLTASGGYGDYTYTLSPPGSGFVIDANGVLSADGTATPGEYTITVEVADEINSKTATWSGKVIII